MPVMQEAKVAVEEVDIFQINDIAVYPAIEKYRIR
jgi:hypothetical protein